MLAAGDISRPEKCGGDFNLESRSLASGLVVRPEATLDEIFTPMLDIVAWMKFRSLPIFRSVHVDGGFGKFNTPQRRVVPQNGSRALMPVQLKQPVKALRGK